MSKPSLPKGTRDFGPDTVRRRTFILNTIRKVFELYGFQPLETPAMENLETLTGKYGEEGDKLMFKVLNNGLNDPGNVDKARAAFENVLQGRSDRNFTERALRYDLTIPFARYVAMNHGKLTFPFKRYQIQPVWRADRPQRGRYREFYQCDADVVGSTSLFNEVELAHIYNDVFTALRLDGYQLRINSRKVLAALATLCGGGEHLGAITIAIDKLDKVGLDAVRDELAQRGLSTDQIAIIEQYLAISGSNADMIAAAGALLRDVPEAQTGLAELSYILAFCEGRLPLHVDFTLARGLDYYTGTIFEVRAPASVQIGSIGGGGRYDDLTGLFGVKGIPGVGISFGVDRIYDVLEELDLFPANVHVSTQVLILNNDEKENGGALALLQRLRARGVRAELYHEPQRVDRQFKYAEGKNIPYVITRRDGGQLQIKDIRSGVVQTLGDEQLDTFAFDATAE